MPRSALFPAVGLALLLTASAARGQVDPDNLEGTAIVTGTRPETRADGLAGAFRDVLAKRSGDPALPTDPRVDPLAAAAEGMVESTLYLDRMSDLPKHDEQGTRDRPYTLIVRFSAAKIDAALASLGEKAWLAPRPVLLPRVTITDAKRATFPLTADGDPDERQREALLVAATRYGLALVLPPSAAPDADTAVADTLTVRGTLVWSDTDPGWRGAWHAPGGQRWGIAGVSFDAAFRNLVLGALAVASGHAPPSGP